MEIGDTAREAAGQVHGWPCEVCVDADCEERCEPAAAQIIQRAINKDNAALKAKVERLETALRDLGHCPTCLGGIPHTVMDRPFVCRCETMAKEE